MQSISSYKNQFVKYIVAKLYNHGSQDYKGISHLWSIVSE